MAALVTIVDLEKELLDIVSQVPSFTDKQFSVFDLKDMEERTEMQSFPMVGVGYDGIEPIDNKTGNAVGNVSTGAHSTMLVNVQFTIVIAVQYHYAGQDDTKPQAFSLLDDVRSRLIGFKGVNSRPWRFIGERPDLSASTNGLVFYLQVWQTAIPAVGSFNNP